MRYNYMKQKRQSFTFLLSMHLYMSTLAHIYIHNHTQCIYTICIKYTKYICMHECMHLLQVLYNIRTYIKYYPQTWSQYLYPSHTIWKHSNFHSETCTEHPHPKSFNNFLRWHWELHIVLLSIILNHSLHTFLKNLNKIALNLIKMNTLL